MQNQQAAGPRRALFRTPRGDRPTGTTRLVQATIRRAVEAVKGVVEWWKKGQRVSCPTFTAETMDYDTRSAIFYRNKASLATVEARAECPFILPADSQTPYEEYVLSEDYEVRENTLRYDATTNEFYLNISMRRIDSDDPEVPADTGHPEQTVLGIDLGVNSRAVASAGTFWQGDDYDHWVREFEKRRGEMQQRGSQAAHNALLYLGKREEAWRTQYIHTVANELVTEAVEHNCDVIVFEELTDIRERLSHAKWHHIWTFRRLFEYVSYKAPEQGVAVEQVKPTHTSQRCSRTDCGFTHQNNRYGEYFKCQTYGYEVNADYNAAKNIGLRYARKRRHRLRSSPTSGSGDAEVDVRITGGTVNGTNHQPITGD